MLKFSFNKFIIASWVLFLFFQVGGQIGVFTNGVNAYTVWSEYDTLTHMLGSFALTSVLIKIITLPEHVDEWKIYVPIIMLASETIWEIVELIITWYRILPPTQMFATPSNSFKDVVIGFLATCTTCFLYQIYEESK
jgi:hypothetical protein